MNIGRSQALATLVANACVCPNPENPPEQTQSHIINACWLIPKISFVFYFSMTFRTYLKAMEKRFKWA